MRTAKGNQPAQSVGRAATEAATVDSTVAAIADRAAARAVPEDVADAPVAGRREDAKAATAEGRATDPAAVAAVIVDPETNKDLPISEPARGRVCRQRVLARSSVWGPCSPTLGCTRDRLEFSRPSL